MECSELRRFNWARDRVGFHTPCRRDLISARPGIGGGARSWHDPAPDFTRESARATGLLEQRQLFRLAALTQCCDMFTGRAAEPRHMHGRSIVSLITSECATCSTESRRERRHHVHVKPGLGYAGRPGGPVPTITRTLQNLPFRLGSFMAALRQHQYRHQSPRSPARIFPRPLRHNSFKTSAHADLLLYRRRRIRRAQ